MNRTKASVYGGKQNYPSKTNGFGVCMGSEIFFNYIVHTWGLHYFVLSVVWPGIIVTIKILKVQKLFCGVPSPPLLCKHKILSQHNRVHAHRSSQGCAVHKACSQSLFRFKPDTPQGGREVSRSSHPHREATCNWHLLGKRGRGVARH